MNTAKERVARNINSAKANIETINANATKVDITEYILKAIDKYPFFITGAHASEISGLSESYFSKSRMEVRRKGRTPPPPHTYIDGRVRYAKPDFVSWMIGISAAAIEWGRHE